MTYPEYQLKTTLNGFYLLTEIIDSKPPRVIRHEIPYLAPLGSYNSATGTPLNENVIFQSLLNGYRFPTDVPEPSPPRVAFTIKSSSVKGGGTIMVYRYAEWLVRLGVEVAIYSDDAPPDWVELTARFCHLTSEVERYAAISEPVVIVYSILELPALLRYTETQGKRIFHLCQGVEDYHYLPPPDKALVVPVPIFDLLNRLPVGRIAVSPHIERFYLQRYGQRTHTIINGIDPETFYPGPSRMTGKDLSVVMLGNPEIPLKGVAQTLAALALLHQRYPEYKSHLHLVCGEDLSGRLDGGFQAPGVTLSVYYRLSSDELRPLLHGADFYVNASYYEGFGIPSLEAMACGVPVVQVDNHGLDGIAVDGENCIMSESQDPNALVAAIYRLLSHPELRSRLIGNGIKTSRRYSIRNQFSMFVEQFQNIIGVSFSDEKVRAIKESLMPTQPHISVETGSILNLPLFSVLVPTYNQAQYLPACLESLLAQSCPNWEAVIVNDGSTDDTREVLEKYASRDSRIRVLHKENGGVATALNLALASARGKWICWLSSDDMFEPDKLEVQIKAFAAHPGIYFFHTNYNVLYEDAARLSAIQLPNDFIPPAEQQVIKFFEINYVNGISICIHRSVFEKVGQFNIALRNGQDFDMWLRISAHYRSQHLDHRTCITRVHPGQGSSLSSFAGIYDSARSCLEFLNDRDFEKLFPLLDLSVAANGLQAIQSVLKILVNPLAYVNTCGYGAALLGRMREWLGQPAQHHCLNFLSGPHFGGLVSGVLASDLPGDLKESFRDFHAHLGRPYEYRPVAIHDMLSRHLQFLERAPGMAQEARALRHYIMRNSKQTDLEVSQESNVPYWQRMQELGYFENHECYGREHNGLVLFGDDDAFIQNYVPLDRGQNVVVIGCGYGRESTLIAPHVRHVFGIDVSDLILDKARAFTASHGVRNFTAVHAERWQQEIPAEIDLVYTLVVFQHLTRALVRQYLSGLAAKLNSGGKFLCQFCESEQGSYNAELKTHEPNVSWTADEIRELVAEQGLQLYRLDSRKVTDDAVWHWAFFGR